MAKHTSLQPSWPRLPGYRGKCLLLQRSCTRNAKIYSFVRNGIDRDGEEVVDFSWNGCKFSTQHLFLQNFLLPIYFLLKPLFVRCFMAQTPSCSHAFNNVINRKTPHLLWLTLRAKELDLKSSTWQISSLNIWGIILLRFWSQGAPKNTYALLWRHVFLHWYLSECL